MSKDFCEKVRISAMAILDGEEPPLSARQVNEHLESCVECRHELEEQRLAAGLLNGKSRRVFAEDVWPRVADCIEAKAEPKHPGELPLLVTLSILLVAYKILEVLPGVDAGVIIKLVPLVAVLVFFSLLKQNPLTISQNLRLEGDTK